MLKHRIIPVLLIKNGALVKSRQFGDLRYLGDPLNAIRVFNEKQADELILLDIGATASGTGPNFSLLEKVSRECRMPLCYGGGIETIEHVDRLIGLGAEKISFGTAIVENLDLVRMAASKYGSQSVVGVLDFLNTGLGRHDLHIRNGLVHIRVDIDALVGSLMTCGVGEIIVQSIDRDGTLTGYDLDLISSIYSLAKVPVTAIGGAGSFDDMITVMRTIGISGLGAGSLFVYSGPYQAVLINYLTEDQRRQTLEIST